MSDESVPRVAVVGLAGRYPGARTVDELWHNLLGGVESISHFSPEELTGVDPQLLADPRYVRAKGVLPDADLFDAAFFGFTPREAELMDPQHRVFLECAWEALEDAGCDPQRAGNRIGVYAGSGANTYLIFNLLPHRELAASTGALQLLLLNDRDFLATRTSYKLGLMGPSVAVQSACSTSLVAIHLACQSLLTGECDLALAGGISISTPLASGYLYQEGSILSPDGHCRAFDAGAAGSVDANGCGVVALKRLADAQADGDRIYAVVRGSAVTNDGPARVGFTAPGVDGQAAAISEALLLADVEADSIGFVQTHGSGTSLGDPIEMEALTRAFRQAGAQRTGACAIGSVKTNLGHTSAGAGAAGFLAATLALTHRTIPPSLHFERPNPRIDFAASPFYVCTQATPWETHGEPRRAGVSAFGLGGTNAHVVLEEAPAPEPSAPPNRQPQLLVVSAKTSEALQAATTRLAEFLGSLESLPSFADLAWTLQTGRRAFEHRRFVVARDLAGAAEALRDSSKTVTGRAAGDGRRGVVFLFPGLGDQAVDMAREIYETEPFFREQVDLCAEKLTPHLGTDLRQVLFSDGPWNPKAPAPETDLRALLRREPRAAAQLDQTAFAQPACFVVEYALARLLMEWGIQPEVMLGYSIGEYVAACLAGVLSLDDALALVARRARLIQDLPAGAMLAVPLPEEEIRPLLGDRLSLCATNGPNFCVVGGPEDAVAGIEARLTGRGVSCLRLQTTHAFHSSMMEPAAEPLTTLAGRGGLQPAIPYLSNVTGTWITSEDLADPGYWARHMRGTVRFAEGLAELLREPGRAFLEIGPGGTLGTLVRQHPDVSADTVTVPTLRRTGGSGSDLDDLVGAVGRLWASGAEVDWERFQGGARRQRVTLPTYPFERKRFWIDAPSNQPSATPVAEPAAETVVASLPEAGGRKGPRPDLGSAYVEPGSDHEKTIAGIWEGLFGIEPIGADDNFLELGGHSLLAIQIMTHLREALDVELPVTALFETPTVASLAKVVAKARGEETEEDLEQLLAFVEGLSPEEALEVLSRPEKAASLLPPPVRPVSGPDGRGDWPLSFDQERLLQMHLDNPELVSWNVDVGSRIRGPLQIGHLLAAFGEVIRRHAAWRTTFPVVDGRRVQRVHPWIAPDFTLIDLTALPAERREAAGRAAIFERTRALFDLDHGPLVRIALARLDEQEHLSAFTIHHLVTDWITFQVCWQELLAVYESRRHGLVPALPPLPVQYPDFVLWEREWLQGEVLERETEFWRRALEGFPRALELPTDKPRPAVQSQRGGFLHIQAGHERTERLRALARQEGVTMFMALLAVLDALFHRLSGEEKIVVGSNSANRARPELDSVFGLFLTQVPFPVDVGGDPTFRELLARVRKSALSVYAHQNLPISRLIEALGLPPDPSRSPVVQALLLVLEGQNTFNTGDLALEAAPLFDGNSRWDLMFGVYDYHDVGLSGPFEYNADIFEAATAERLLGLFYRLIDEVTADPDIRLSSLPGLQVPQEREAGALQESYA